MPDNDKDNSLGVCMDLALEQSAAFDVAVRELVDALARLGIDFAAGPTGRVLERGFEVGRVISWKPGERILMQWRPADWLPEEVTEIELLFEKRDGGTRVTLKHRGWDRLIKEPDELVGWFASEVAAPILRVLAPDGFGDWMTDRRARRPSGSQARSVYRDPLFHYPNFRVILAELALTREDYLLEVGCGGGALLKPGDQSRRGRRRPTSGPAIQRRSFAVRGWHVHLRGHDWCVGFSSRAVGRLPRNPPCASSKWPIRCPGKRFQVEGNPCRPRANGFPAALLRRCRTRMSGARCGFRGSTRGAARAWAICPGSGRAAAMPRAL
ncbi:MAG: hypothetical protein DME21_13210 [Verrucomicrobia bacterium]|nr:MAG: hypothetical protein DME21_13210 [Verrucomicrobiota bacterium]